MDLNNINVLVLAYLGDTIYEDYIRKSLIKRGIAKVNDLQKAASSYVSATNQAKFLKMLLDKNFFSEEELSIIRRARNSKNNSHPKSCDIITYKYATALEAIIGYYELKEDKKRISEIMKEIIGDIL